LTSLLCAEDVWQAGLEQQDGGAVLEHLEVHSRVVQAPVLLLADAEVGGEGGHLEVPGAAAEVRGQDVEGVDDAGGLQGGAADVGEGLADAGAVEALDVVPSPHAAWIGCCLLLQSQPGVPLLVIPSSSIRQLIKNRMHAYVAAMQYACNKKERKKETYYVPSRMSNILSATSLKGGADAMASTSVNRLVTATERSPGRMRVS